MLALCQASELQAMARGSSARGISIGPMAVLAGAKKVRSAPNPAAAISSSGTEAKPRQTATASSTAMATSPA